MIKLVGGGGGNTKRRTRVGNYLFIISSLPSPGPDIIHYDSNWVRSGVVCVRPPSPPSPVTVETLETAPRVFWTYRPGAYIVFIRAGVAGRGLQGKSTAVTEGRRRRVCGLTGWPAGGRARVFIVADVLPKAMQFNKCLIKNNGSFGKSLRSVSPRCTGVLIRINAYAETETSASIKTGA